MQVEVGQGVLRRQQRQRPKVGMGGELARSAEHGTPPAARPTMSASTDVGQSSISEEN